MAREPTGGILRWPTPRSRQWVEEYLERSSRGSEVLAVIAIGSGVRRGVRSVDVDLLTITDGPPQRVRAPIEVDVRQIDASEIESKLRQGNDLLGWAIMYGKVLVERDRFWTEFAKTHRGRVPLPSSDEARMRAERAQRHVHALIEIGDADAAAEQLASVFTHLARAALIDRKVYPASRPELPSQLRGVGEVELAQALDDAMARTRSPREILDGWGSTRV
jgi:hypothetical protein